MYATFVDKYGIERSMDEYNAYCLDENGLSPPPPPPPLEDPHPPLSILDLAQSDIYGSRDAFESHSSNSNLDNERSTSFEPVLSSQSPKSGRLILETRKLEKPLVRSNTRKEVKSNSVENVLVSEEKGLFNSQKRVTDKSDEWMNSAPLRDIFTGQRLFEPQIDPLSNQLARKTRNLNQPIEKHLQARGVEYQNRARLREENIRRQSIMQREAPKISQNSEKIVKVKELLSGETAQDRLLKPIGEVKASVLEAIERPSFRPKINKKSEDIVMSSYGHLYNPAVNVIPPVDQANVFFLDQSISQRYKGNDDIDRHAYYDGDDGSLTDSSYYYDVGEGVFTLAPSSPSSAGGSLSISSGLGASSDPVTAVHLRSEAWVKDRARRLERERLERESQLDKECSFKPKLKENKSFAASTEVRSYSNASTIADRQVEWLRKREEKLERERKKKEAEALDGYTFQPQISRPPNSTSQANNSASNSFSSSKRISNTGFVKSKPEYQTVFDAREYMQEEDLKGTKISSKNSQSFEKTKQPSIDSRIDSLLASSSNIEASLPNRIKIPPNNYTEPLMTSPRSELSKPTDSRIRSTVGLRSAEISVEDRVAMMLNGWADEDEPEAPLPLKTRSILSLSNKERSSGSISAEIERVTSKSPHRKALRNYEMDAL